MAKHKIEIEKVEYLNYKLKAMSHPMRIAILELLEEKPMNVTEIYKTLELAQADASHHIAILKNIGLISKTHAGKSNLYSIKRNALNGILDLVDMCLEV